MSAQSDLRIAIGIAGQAAVISGLRGVHAATQGIDTAAKSAGRSCAALSSSAVGLGRSAGAAAVHLSGAGTAARAIGSGAGAATVQVKGLTGSLVVAQAATGAFVGAAKGLAGVFVGAASQASTFERQVSAIAAVSGATSEEMATLQKLALQLGADTSFSAQEAAQGIEELVKAGVSIADIMGGAGKASLDLAAAGAVSVADAAEIASNAMNAFGIKGSEMAGVADTIAGAANASAISVTDFKFALAAVGAVAATAGLSFNDTAVAIAELGQAGIKGSDAGTSLKAFIAGLTPSSKAATQAMRDLGLIAKDGTNRFFDAQGRMKSMAEIQQILQEATKDLTEQQKLMALETIFGSDAIRAAAVLAKEGSEGYREMAAAMGKVSAADVAAKRLDNLSGSVEKFKGSLATAAITVGLGFTPALKRIVDGATGVLNAWMPAITAFAEKIPAAMDRMIDRALALWPSFLTLFGRGSAALPVLVERTTAVFWSLLDAARSVFDTIVSTAQGAWPTIKSAFSTLLPVVLAVGTAFLENLAGTVRWITSDVLPPLVSIVQQTAGFFLGTLLPAFQKTTAVMRRIFGETLAWLAQTVWPLLLVIAGQTAAFWTGTLLPAIQRVAGPLRQAFGETLQWIADSVWPRFLSVAGVAVDFLSGTVAPMLPGLAKSIRDQLGGAISWIAQTGWPTFVSAAQTAWSFLTTKVIPVVSDLVGWLREKVPPAVQAVLGAFEAVRSRLQPIIQALFNGDIKTALSKAGAAFSEFASLAMDWLSAQVAKIDWTAVWAVAKDVLSGMAAWFANLAGQALTWIGDQVAKIDWGAVWAYAKDVTATMVTWFTDVAVRFSGWVGDQVAKIDWAAVWAYAVDVGSKMSTWFVDVATRFAGWIGDQVSKIDWGAVWAAARDVTAKMGQWFVGVAQQFTAWIGAEVAKIDWGDIWNQAVSVATAMTAWLDEQISTMDWQALGKTFGRWIVDALVAVVTTIAELAVAIGTWVGDSIVAAFNGDAENSPAGKFLKALGGMVVSVQRGVTDFLLGMLQGAWEAAMQRFTPTLPSFGTGGTTVQQSSRSTMNQAQSTASITKGPIDNSSRAAFVKTAFPHMLEAARGDRALAEMMLAKAISENGDIGKGGAFIGNNFSGIKGVGDAGSFTARTWEMVNGQKVYMDQQFAAYSTPEEGMKAFLKFLEDNKRYAQALEAYRRTGNVQQLFRDINMAGYATDPAWADKVENIRVNQVAPLVQDLGAAQTAAQGASAATARMGETVQAASGPISDADRAVVAVTTGLMAATEAYRATGQANTALALDALPTINALEAQGAISAETAEQLRGLALGLLKARESATNAEQPIRDAATATTGLSDAARIAADPLGAAARKAEEMAKGAEKARGEISMLADDLMKLPDWFTPTGSGGKDGKRKVEPIFKPFADGGIVTGPTLGLIGEAGPEAVIPLSRAGALGVGPSVVFGPGAIVIHGSLIAERDLEETVAGAVNDAWRRGRF